MPHLLLYLKFLVTQLHTTASWTTANLQHSFITIKAEAIPSGDWSRRAPAGALEEHPKQQYINLKGRPFFLGWSGTLTVGL